MMQQHLREDEYSSILAGSTRQEWLRHLKECPQCERRLQQEQQRIEHLRTLLVAAGNRPESYWQAQHTRISARLREQKTESSMPIWRLATAGALTVILAAFSWSLAQHSRHPVVEPAPHASLSDAQLIQEMEEAANSEVPPAMEPADVLVHDMEANTGSDTGSYGHKTGTH